MVFKSRRHTWLTAKHKYKPYHSMCACLGWCVHFIEKKKELMEDNPSNQETEQNGDNLPKKNIQHATALVFVYVAYNLNGKIFHCMWLILFNCGTAECICKSGNTCFHQFLFHNYTPYRWLSAGCLAFTFSMSLSLPPTLSLYIYISQSLFHRFILFQSSFDCILTS